MRIRLALFAAALFLALLTTASAFGQSTQPSLTVRFLDVGQGDGAWLTTPDGKTILIDCGPFSYGRRLVVDIQAAGVERINVLAPSHAHADHIGGCIEVVRRLPVDEVLWTGQTDTSTTWRTFWSEVQQRQLPLTRLVAGQVFDWGGGVTATVYNPGEIPDGVPVNEYDDSHVLLVEYLGTRLLFVGDIHARGERQAVAAGLPRVDILKVSEHGSASGSSPTFLAAIQPRLAILSYAVPNAFDLPSQLVLNRLAAVNASTLATAEHGTISIGVNGYTVATDR
ncbi:MAG TPA: MBL fold metallo-hydrolase [Chloroflexota bacterium]|nr:MBL fold metallo-hydrolase [Chloroflexota bacterium]